MIVELVARPVFAPAAVAVLDLHQPGDRLAELGRGVVESGGIERAQHGPGAVDVVHAPAAIPAAVAELRLAQVVDRLRDGLAFGFAELREHGDAARGDILGRRIEQSAVVGERDVVEIVEFVVGVERAPGAVLALHADDPFARRRDRGAKVALRREPLRAFHRHHHHGGIVGIGIMRIGVLERPAAGLEIGAPRDPVTLHIEDLLGRQPVEALAGRVDSALAADLQQGVAGEPGVPDRRDAGLAVGVMLVHREELLHRLARDRPLRLVLRVAEHVEHHHAVGHGREDRAQTVLAVEAFGDPGLGRLDRTLARALREERLGRVQHRVDTAENPKPHGLLLWRLGRRSDRLRRLEKQLVDRHALGVARLGLERLQHQERHDDGTAPIGDLVEMEREPLRQQHDLDRHDRHGPPRNEAEQRQHQPREHIGRRRAAAEADRLARAHHVRGIDGIADHLEREIGFHARAHVEGAVLEQRPAAVVVVGLDAPQVDRDLALELGGDGLAEIVPQQHVFGWNGGVGLELEHPMPIGTLQREQRVRRGIDAAVERRDGRLFGGHGAHHDMLIRFVA